MLAALSFGFIVAIGAVGLVAVTLILIVVLRKSPATLDEIVTKLADVHKVSEASQLLVDAGRYQDAIALLTQHRRLREAAKIHLHVGDHPRAAAIFSNLKDHEAAANCYLKSGNKEAAAAEYEKGGLAELAANVLMQAGKLPEAAKAYLTAKQYQKAAAVFNQLGQKKKAAAIMGAWYAATGDFVNAAKSFYVAGKMKEAGDAFFKGGLHEKAAQVYEKVGEFAAAAKARLQAGDVESAAEHFERIGDTEAAIRLFEAAGKWNKVVECHKQDKNWLALGNIMMRLEKYDLGIEFFKRLTPLDEGYAEAAMSVASILEGQGDLEGAKKKYLEILEFKGLAVSNAPALFALCTLCERTNTPDKPLQYLRQFKASGPVGEKAENWRNRLEQQVITAAQTMAVGLEVAEEEDVKTSDNVEVAMPQKAGLSDRYDVVDKIGQGGHGVIYKAFDKTLGREVVLKFLFRNQVPSEMARRYFLREAKTTASLNHANIVTLFDMGQIGDNLFIAMEFIDGITLEDILQPTEEITEFDRIMDIVEQLSDALQYAHDKTVIHRDIKPANIMLTGTKRDIVKLMDFGLAKALDENPHKTLIVCGTPLYMSPEQIGGDFVDHLSDIYSLGVLVFELFTGKPPFPAANILAHHQFSPPPHPTTINKAVPVAVGDVILKCLAKKREERFDRALDFVAELKDALDAGNAGGADGEPVEDGDIELDVS